LDAVVNTEEGKDFSPSKGKTKGRPKIIYFTKC